MRPLVAALIIALSSASASAQGPGQPGPFAQGRISPKLGFGFSFNSNASVDQSFVAYYIVAAGAGYYVLDGVEVSLDVEHWIGTEGLYDITKVRPGVRYVVWFLPLFQPYAGAFYRHWFSHGGDDADTVGIRLGAIFMIGRSLFLDVGAMYEYMLQDLGGDRGVWAPDISLGFSF